MEVRFTKSAYQDYLCWKKHDTRKIQRIKKLCEDIVKKPFKGIGKPEPLKYDFQGFWSRRIDRTHRIIYKIDDEGILILSCRYHY